MKFCAQGTGKVVVRLAHEEGCVRVDVEDNGVGIGRQHQAVIFEKFRQVGDTLTQKEHPVAVQRMRFPEPLGSK